jgi:hypothetical protein
MGNPNPVQSEGFIKSQFKRDDESTEPLASKIIGLRLPQSVYDKLMTMKRSDRVKLMKEAVTKAVQEI